MPLTRPATALAALWCVFGAAAPAFAGGGPENVLVLVNDASPDSLAIANHYRLARGIPDGNFCHCRFAPQIQMEADDFDAAVLTPLRAFLATAPCAPYIRFIAVTEGFPYRVHAWKGNNTVAYDEWVGVTAAVATLDGRARSIHHDPYKLEHTDWYAAEHAFRGTPELPYLGIALMGDAPADVLHCIDRGRAADGTKPRGTIYLFEGVGPRQRLVAGQPPVDQQAPLVALLAERGITAVKRPEHSLTDEQDVFGYFTGFTKVKTEGLGFLPGALADHLTSFGGIIKGKNGQMPCTRFIAGGATGTYGTVHEPTNIFLRFPQAFVYERYTRGFSLIESYWMSVGEPRIGIFVGEPLATPFADRPTVTVSGVAAGEEVSGTVEWRLTATPAGGGPVRDLQAWLDGRPWPAGPALRLQAGTRLSLTIGGTTATVGVADGWTVGEAVAALGAALPASAPVEARAEGERLKLRAREPGPAGNDLEWRVAVLPPEAGGPTVGPFTAAVRCATPTGKLAGGAPQEQPRARVKVLLQGTPSVGDRIAIAHAGKGFEVVVQAGDDLQKLAVKFIQLLAKSGIVHVRTPEEMQAQGSNSPVPAALGQNRLEVHLLSRREAEAGNGDPYTITFTPAKGSKFKVGPTGAVPAEGGATVDHHATAALAFDLAVAAIADAPLSIDTTTLASGPHRLRLLVEEATDVATQGWTFVDFTVANEKGELRLKGPSEKRPVTGPFTVTPQLFRAARGSHSDIRFFIDGRSLGELVRNRRAVKVDPAAFGLGAGSHAIVAEILEDDGRTPFLRSAPLVFEYAPPAPPPPPAKDDGKGKNKGKR